MLSIDHIFYLISKINEKNYTISLHRRDTTIAHTPIPTVKEGELLIKTRYSLISKGTEKMLVEFGKSSSINVSKTAT